LSAELLESDDLSRVLDMNKLEFMLFGKGKFSYPAKNQFAPIMIVTFAGALSTGLEGYGSL
jgi:hypothetical protein